MPVESAYIDTSVLGAYYCAEPLSDAAEEALARTGAPLISALCEVEFTSLIARKQQLGELSESQARERLALLRLHLVEGVFGRIPIGAGHYTRAAELIAAMDSPLRTLDALHLAVAIAAHLPLITADHDFATSARRHGATVVLVA